MSTCTVQASATLDLYFYGELTGVEREAVERHLPGCAECRLALEELTVIRAALESQPVVSAPPGEDWSRFMARLQQAVSAERGRQDDRRPADVLAYRSRNRLVVGLAMAALITLVTLSVLLVVKDRPVPKGTPTASVAPPVPAVSSPAARQEPPTQDEVFTQASGQLFERSKLVVLGLATKDASGVEAADWNYERNLAASLLDDTRLYRQAAESRGMKTLANVMGDLELVLLQTSMAEDPDAASLAQLQRLIRRRDLITKMDVVTTSGLLP
jgi:hypothetical protein